MIIISTISEASFRHVQGITSRDLWLSLEKAYAPHSIYREYTLKTQLLRIEMHGDETPDAYLNHAQEYADALATIGEPVKDKDLVMLAVSCLREEYNGLKTTIAARQSPSAFSKLHALLSDHDLSPIAPSGPQAFYGVRPSNNRNNNINNRGNRNNSRGNNNNRGRCNGRQFDWTSTQNLVNDTSNRCGIGHIPSQCPNCDPCTIHTRPSANFAYTHAESSNASANWRSDTRANSHVTHDLEAMENSEAYYGDDTLHVGNAATITPPRSDPISSLSLTIRSNQRLDPQIHRSTPHYLVVADVGRSHQKPYPLPMVSLFQRKTLIIQFGSPTMPTFVCYSTISEASFHHVQGITSRDLWLSFEKAYAPYFIFREYTLKTQLLRIEMHGDETPDAYLNCAQEYSDALAAISEPAKDKDLVMLAVSCLREEYNGLKTTITARQSLSAFSELHANLIDHDYAWKTYASASSITSSYAANYAVGSPSMPTFRNNNNNNRGNRNNSRGNNNNRGRGNGRQFDWTSTQNTMYATCNRCGIGHISSKCPNRDPSTIRTRPSANFANTHAQSVNDSANWHSDTGENSHVTHDLEAMDNSEAYYGDDTLHVRNGKDLPILYIGSSKVTHHKKCFL
nr:hypothetical protein [Tanacetum cinerariifolium]